MAFRYVGRSKLMLERAHNGTPSTTTDAILWQDNPRGGGVQRNFFVRPLTKTRYHLRIIVGTVTTTDRDSIAKKEIISAARLMGIEMQDGHWAEVNALL